MGTAPRWAAGGLLAVVSAVALSACSSNPSATKGTTTTTHRPTTTTSTSTTSTTSTSSTSTTTTTTPGPSLATCQVSGLRVSVVGQGGAAGTQELTFALTNSSSRSCSTYGYPGLLLIGTTGKVLTTTAVRGGGLSFENVPPSQVTLAAGATAYFNVGFSDVTTSNTTCSSTHTIAVTPPTNTTHASVKVALGIDACDNGMLHVSAVFGATNSAATQTTAPS